MENIKKFHQKFYQECKKQFPKTSVTVISLTDMEDESVDIDVVSGSMEEIIKSVVYLLSTNFTREQVQILLNDCMRVMDKNEK